MKVKEAIHKIKDEAGFLLPNTDASIMELMEYVMQVNETGVMQKISQELTEKQEKKLNKAIKRLQDEEPLEYITGLSHFYGHRFKVNKHTLIPRVETEMLVALAMERIYENLYGREKKQIKVLDMGTGSGCILISLAKAAKGNIEFTGIDISKEALKIARENISAYGLEKQITLKESNLFEEIEIKAENRFDIIVANLPYIPDGDMDNLPKSVKAYEPSNALKAGPSGVELIEKLLEISPDYLKPEGSIILEAQPSLMDQIKEISSKSLPKADYTSHKDTFDKERFAVIQL
jgi:release factor glutamine methyltransferase